MTGPAALDVATFASAWSTSVCVAFPSGCFFAKADGGAGALVVPCAGAADGARTDDKAVGAFALFSGFSPVVAGVGIFACEPFRIGEFWLCFAGTAGLTFTDWGKGGGGGRANACAPALATPTGDVWAALPCSLNSRLLAAKVAGGADVASSAADLFDEGGASAAGFAADSILASSTSLLCS